jgi:hypothetical protein
MTDRPINEREIALVKWLLKGSQATGSWQHREESVSRLRVVGECGCGCASVDFEKDGQSSHAHPIADAEGKTPAGLNFGLILWGRDGALTGLEIYELDPGSADTLPPPDWLVWCRIRPRIRQ